MRKLPMQIVLDPAIRITLTAKLVFGSALSLCGAPNFTLPQRNNHSAVGARSEIGGYEHGQGWSASALTRRSGLVSKTGRVQLKKLDCSISAWTFGASLFNVADSPGRKADQATNFSKAEARVA